MEKLACTLPLPSSVNGSIVAQPTRPAPPLRMLKRAPSITGPCARCGSRALIMDDPYHLTARPLCPDHWFEHRHQAMEYLAQQIAIPRSCLRFSDLLSTSARKILMSDPNKPTP